MAEVGRLLSRYEAKNCAAGLKKSLLQNEQVPKVVVQCLNNQLDTEIHASSVQLVRWLCELQDQQIDELQVFVLQFLPNVVSLYVHPTPNMEFNATIELCVKNYLQQAQKSKVFDKVQAPHIARPSVYHKPSSDIPQLLTVSALQKHDHVELDTLHKAIDFKNITEENSSSLMMCHYPWDIRQVLASGYQDSKVTMCFSSNKMKRTKVPISPQLNFLNALVQVYKFYVSSMSRLSHLQYCHFCTRLSLQGMHYTASLADTCTSGDCLSSSQLEKLSSLKRHKLSSAVLCSLLTGMQKIVFQYVSPSARQSLKAMDMRSKYELYPAAIQLSRSIRTLLEHVRSSKVDYKDSTNVLIDGLALTDPRFSQYPMLLSLLKFHSPSASATDNIHITSSAATHSDSSETEV